MVEQKTDLLEIVEKAYKKYNLALLIFFIFLCLKAVVFSMVTMSQKIITFSYIINVILLIFVLWNVYQVTKILRTNNKDKTHPLLWVISIFLPLFNIIAILLIYNKTRKFIKELRG